MKPRPTPSIPRHRRASIVVVVLATAALAQAPVPAPAHAAPVPSARDLPALPTQPVPTSRPAAPTGDFTNPPDPNSPPSRSTARPSDFDPARSTPIDAETTPTRRLYRNPSGSYTAVINQ